jgi:hypothetical protein
MLIRIVTFFNVLPMASNARTASEKDFHCQLSSYQAMTPGSFFSDGQGMTNAFFRNPRERSARKSKQVRSQRGVY